MLTPLLITQRMALAFEPGRLISRIGLPGTGCTWHARAKSLAIIDCACPAYKKGLFSHDFPLSHTWIWPAAKTLDCGQIKGPSRRRLSWKPRRYAQVFPIIMGYMLPHPQIPVVIRRAAGGQPFGPRSSVRIQIASVAQNCPAPIAASRFICEALP